MWLVAIILNNTLLDYLPRTFIPQMGKLRPSDGHWLAPGNVGYWLYPTSLTCIRYPRFPTARGGAPSPAPTPSLPVERLPLMGQSSGGLQSLSSHRLILLACDCLLREVRWKPWIHRHGGSPRGLPFSHSPRTEWLEGDCEAPPFCTAWFGGVWVNMKSREYE